MSKNNKSLASQALLEMEEIKKAIKEESKNTLRSVLSEAVKDALRNSIEDDDEKDYEVDGGEDDAKSDKEGKDEEPKSCKGEDCEEGDIEEDDDMQADPNADPNAQEMPAEPGMEGDDMGAEGADMGAEQAPEAGAEGEGEDGWSDFQQYQTGDNTYDLTGVQDMGVVKAAYKKMGPDDLVVVKKGDTLSLKDNETGSEYMIELGDAEEEGGEQAPEGEEQMDDLNEGFEFEINDDNDNDFIFNDDDEIGASDESGIEDSFNDDSFVADDEGIGASDEFEGEPDGELGRDGFEPAGFGGKDEESFNNRFEGKKSRKTMKESKSKKNEILFEIDLGYTDNYQSKDPIQGLSNSEPSKSGKSWEKGVPTGTAKPWAGETKSKGDPFKKTQKVQGSVNEEDIEDVTAEEPEIEEGMNVGGKVQQRSSSKSKVHQVDDEHFPDNIRHYTKGTDYKERKHMDESLNKIKKENKMLKEAIKELRKNLNEAYITNVNLGKITKLFLENAVSQEEKVNIINRFVNEAKTVDQSKQLFESISKDLQKVAKTNLTESRMTAEGSKKLNENTIYKSQDLLDTLNFMKRMENL